MKTVYIIGIGRSGTTLLTSLLGNHPFLNTTPENYFMTFFHRAFHKKRKFNFLDYKLVNEFSESFHKLQPIVSYKYNFNTLQTTQMEGNYKVFCDTIYKCYEHLSNHNENATIIVDKNPVNTLHLKKIKQFNPDARFIFITRDYRSNILSRLQSVHIHSPNPIYNGLRWNYFMKKAIRFTSKNAGIVHQIKYEDLVLHPQESMDQIFNFLKVPILSIDKDQSNEKESIQNSDKHLTNDRFKKKYTDLASPISTSRIASWKNELNQKIINQIDFICQPIGRSLGYEPIKKTTFSAKVFITLLSLPQRFRLGVHLLKDTLTDFLPITIKIARFKKFVSKIESARKSNK